MSYNRMQENLNDIKLPINNGELYPPIPLPEPSTAGVQGMQGIQMEAGQILIHNTPGVVIEHGLLDKDDDRSELEPKAIAFNDRTIRSGFIRKVYSILVIQLLFTCGIISFFIYHEPTKLFVQMNPFVLVVAFVIHIILLISMACCETARRTVPINFVCLGLFTVTMSALLGAVSSTMDANVVLLALGITALFVIALSIFAMQTKYDFTACGPVLVCCLLCVIVFGMTAVLWQNMLLYTTYACVGALLASFFLIYDTQLIIGGKHKYKFSPEEYIFAALTLYMDVVRIFLYVLRMFARR